MTNTLTRKTLSASAAAIGVAAVLAVPPTAQAAPDCTDWVFNGSTKVLEDPPAWTISFASNSKVVPGTVTFTKPPGSDATDGPSTGSGGIDGSSIRMVLNGIVFQGNIGQDGNASGNTVFPTPGPNDPGWHLAAPLKCNTPVKVAPTDAVRMDIDKRPITATVSVRNESDLSGKCNYDATGTSGVFAPPLHRDFTIGPKGSNTFDVPAPPLGSSYHVVLSCKGDFEGKQVEFGHVEQNVSSF